MVIAGPVRLTDAWIGQPIYACQPSDNGPADEHPRWTATDPPQPKSPGPRLTTPSPGASSASGEPVPAEGDR